MASPLVFKVYNRNGLYVAALRYAEDAAIAVTNAGPGSKVKAFDRLVWREGTDKKSDGCASFSFDDAADLMYERIRARRYVARKPAA